MPRPRNDVSGTGRAKAPKWSIKENEKKAISGSDALLLHRRMRDDTYKELGQNLELKRNNTDYCKEPTPSLPIDEQINLLIIQQDINYPRIDLSRIHKKYVRCPYEEARSNISDAIIMADEAVEKAAEEDRKYENALEFLSKISTIEELWTEISTHTKPWDFTPYAPRFMPHRHVINLTQVYDGFDSMNAAMEGIAKLKSAASDLVDAKKDIRKKGGSPGQIWQRAFAEHLALCWCSLTDQNLDNNKHKVYLEDFIDAAFKSIYQAFRKNLDKPDGSQSIYANFSKIAPRQSWSSHTISACEALAARRAHEQEQDALPDDGREPTHVRIFNTPLGRPGFASQGAVRADARARDALAVFDAAGTAEEKNRAAFDFLVSFSVDLLSEEGQKTADNIRRGIFFGHFFYILDPPMDSETS